jgi:hypothetical protein
MANVTFVSATLPSLVAEAARLLFIAERALATPQTNITIALGDALMTVSGTLPKSSAVDAATANIVSSLTDYTPDSDPVLTGTPIAGITAGSLSEALFAAVVQHDAALQTRIDANLPVPAGVGATYSISDAGATFTVVLPVVYSIGTDGSQLATVPNYLA